MTLIVTASHPAFAVMVSDRRLSSALPDGTAKIIDDDAGKLGYLVSRDASTLYGFTGLAYVGEHDRRLFDTMGWIRDTLYNVPELNFDALVHHLATSATKAFASDLLRRVKDKRLTIVFAGFYGAGDPVSAIVSNFELDWPPEGKLFNEAFGDRIWRGTTRENTASAVFFQGAHLAVSTQTIRSFNQLLLDGKPLEAVRGKAEKIILEAADHPAALGTIGKRVISSYILPPVANMEPEPSSRYITDVPSASLPGIDTLILRANASYAIFNLRVGLEDNSDIAFPKQPRNALCSCGSGLKFKKCHGR